MNESSGRADCGSVFWRMPSRVTETLPAVLEKPRALMPGIEPLSTNVVMPGASSVASMALLMPRSCIRSCVITVNVAGSSRTGMSRRVPPEADASNCSGSSGRAASTSTFWRTPLTSSITAAATGVLCTTTGRRDDTNPVPPDLDAPFPGGNTAHGGGAVRVGLDGAAFRTASQRDVGVGHSGAGRVGDGDGDLRDILRRARIGGGQDQECDRDQHPEYAGERSHAACAPCAERVVERSVNATAAEAAAHLKSF